MLNRGVWGEVVNDKAHYVWCGSGAKTLPSTVPVILIQGLLNQVFANQNFNIYEYACMYVSMYIYMYVYRCILRATNHQAARVRQVRIRATERLSKLLRPHELMSSSRPLTILAGDRHDHLQHIKKIKVNSL